jgi:hypothetical protein
VAIPGFTAAASLYASRLSYPTIGSGMSTVRTRGVTPALPLSPFRCALLCAACSTLGGAYCWHCRNCDIVFGTHHPQTE